MSVGQSPERREGLLRAARALAAEAGPHGGAVIRPELAERLVDALVADVAAAIVERSGDPRTLEDVAEALVDGALAGAEPWRDALPLTTAWLEHLSDFGAWSQVVAPWLEAVERLLIDAQERGLVRGDIDTAAAAFVLRDVVDRAVRASLLFGREGYRATALALVRAALRT
jgi:hypothetical protein